MITLYHAPRSRSSRIIWLLEELGCEYKIELVPILRGDGSGTAAADSYLALNPLRKVPTVKIFDEVVYESGAICLYLTDSHPKKDIGPLPGHNDRAEYVRLHDRADQLRQRDPLMPSCKCRARRRS